MRHPASGGNGAPGRCEDQCRDLSPALRFGRDDRPSRWGLGLLAGEGVGCAGGSDGWSGWVVGTGGFDGTRGVDAGHGDGAAAEAGEDLRLEVVGGAGVVGKEEGVGAAAGADVAEGVEVLGEQDEGHDFAGGGAGDAVLEVLDGGGEAVDDGLALAGDAVALESFGFGFGLGLFDLEDLFGFATSLRGDLSALGGVDVVHRGFDFDVGDDVGDERGEDVEAEAGHDGVELVFDGDGDAGLLLEGLVEGELGDVAEDAVEDEGLDLLLRGGELVEGVVDLVVENLVLHADGDLYEDVVVGLGFDGELGLLDLEIDEVDALGEGEQEAQAGAGDAVEFAEALDDTGGEGADGVVGFGDGDEDEERNDEENDEDNRHARAFRVRGSRILLRGGRSVK
jgi:hypothetical protein